MESADKKPTRIVAQSVHPVPSGGGVSNRKLWATICYYYPQYTLSEAKRLSAKDIKLLLKVAQSKEAEKYLTLVQIAAAPHTKDGKGVRKLIDYFTKQIDR